MSIINLIPPKIKREQYVKKIAGVIFSSLFVTVLILLITFTAIYGINYYLEQALKNTEQELAEAETKVASLKSIEESVNDINIKIKKIDGLMNDNMNWHTMIQELNASVPDQIRIDTLSIDLENESISITGVGETRREIVKLQEKLNTLEYFEKLNFTTSAYTTTFKAYTFTMNGELTIK